MNQRRFMIGPQTWSSTSAFPVFNNICDLAASSLSIIFHGGEATVALRSFMKQGSLFWDFFNKSYFFLYFRVGVFMFVYVHSCAKICIKCLGPILTFKSLKVWKCGFETSCSKGGFDSQRPRDFAAPRAPAGGAAFWRPAPRAPLPTLLLSGYSIPVRKGSWVVQTLAAPSLPSPESHAGVPSQGLPPNHDNHVRCSTADGPHIRCFSCPQWRTYAIADMRALDKC